MNKKSLAVAASIALLSSTAVSAADDAVDVSRTSKVYLRSTCDVTEGSVDDVKVQGIFPAIAAALLPNLISGAVDMVGKALEAQAASKTKTITTLGTESLLSIDTAGAAERASRLFCLHVIFADPSAKENDRRIPRGAKPDDRDEVAIRELAAKLKEQHKLAGLPYLYFEGRVQLSPDERFFRVRPHLVYYKKPMVDSAWGGTDSRNLALTLTLAKPGGDAFASTVLKLNEVKADSYLREEALPQDTEWLPMLGLDDDEKAVVAGRKAAHATLKAAVDDKSNKESALKQIEAALEAKYEGPKKWERDHVEAFCKALTAAKKNDHPQCPLPTFLAMDRAEYHLGQLELAKTLPAARLADAEAEKVRVKAQAAVAEVNSKGSISAGLVNISVGLSETREPSKFYEYLSGAFNKSKEGITTALQNDLIKANRVAAKKTERDKEISDQNAKDDARIAYFEAQVEVADKEEALASLAANATAAQKKKAQEDLRIAKIKANQAARKAGMAVPYPAVAAL